MDRFRKVEWYCRKYALRFCLKITFQSACALFCGLRNRNVNFRTRKTISMRWIQRSKTKNMLEVSKRNNTIIGCIMNKSRWQNNYYKMNVFGESWHSAYTTERLCCGSGIELRSPRDLLSHHCRLGRGTAIWSGAEYTRYTLPSAPRRAIRYRTWVTPG